LLGQRPGGVDTVPYGWPVSQCVGDASFACARSGERDYGGLSRGRGSTA
jgi:hypothetical protein